MKDILPSPTFYIDSLPVYGDVILAPMDGISDLPYRSICRELGSALSYTEFINALDILQGHPYVHEKFAFLPQERPVVFQLFDSVPERLLEVALRLQEFEPDVIDINMGCSASDVSGRGAGAGLLRNPPVIARIFDLLSHALHVPVTGKIRLGWDDQQLNHVQTARIIAEHGGKLIAVHGRTRTQSYRGRANWDAIAEVQAAVSVPVIANGDVACAADIERLKTHTGCPAVMVGRGAVGNPWIFSHLDRQQVERHQVYTTMLRHLERMLAFHGPQRGVFCFRKHASRYLSPYAIPAALRRRLLTTPTASEVCQILRQILVDSADSIVESGASELLQTSTG